jgi:hypothetical protein
LKVEEEEKMDLEERLFAPKPVFDLDNALSEHRESFEYSWGHKPER